MDDKTELVFYVTQRSTTTPAASMMSLQPQTQQQSSEPQAKRVLSTLVFNHLNKQEMGGPSSVMGSLKTTPTIKQQLEQISVLSFYPLIGFSDEQLKSYLDSVPAGLNPLLWEQAKKNNPNSKKLLPIQIVGFHGKQNKKTIIIQINKL